MIVGVAEDDDEDEKIGSRTQTSDKRFTRHLSSFFFFYEGSKRTDRRCFPIVLPGINSDANES